MSEIPVPIFNYVRLIREEKSPYYDIARYVVEDMKKHLFEKTNEKEVICHINPRRLRTNIEEKIKDKKLTTINVCRTVLALFYGNGLEEGEDYYITTTSRGRRNYHVKLNSNVLSSFKIQPHSEIK